MIESISDVLSVFVVAFITLYGIYAAFRIHDRNRQRTFESLAQSYYRYYDEADDEMSEDKEGIYYEGNDEL